ncbi:amidase [Cupriavidus respiraculi]|uniref:Glutamyl-tRNA(Gln) amidotransferase subunit A n=1 Tax=Cupriavidus respiraculi TaxID=195930 RepID=A0ABM8WFX1_9BURK|nr:amidase [Cupriavidus respiraculi]CAG9166231.1 Glutamyl-tRNA(Gln) amidotransferase subunit A [Cupriavidus respiraculi]
MAFPTLSTPGSVQQHIAAAMAHVRERDQALHAFIELDEPGAMQRARALDGLPQSGHGRLHGMPVAIKEVIDVAGRLCAWGSPLHAGRRPADDAPLVRRLIDAGAVPIGITASTEYALAAAAATVHPRDARRSPGASSSGSAAAVGAGMVPVALGTQTIGSIIRPAAYCGVVGFKPSYGRYPTDGMLCLSKQLDHAGVLAASVAHVIAVDPILAGDDRTASIEQTPRLRVVRPWFEETMAEAVSVALDTFHESLRRAGFGLDELVIDADVAAAEAALTDTLLTFELARRHGATLHGAPDKVSAELRAMLARGEAVSESRFGEAVAQQAAFSGRLDAMLGPGEFALAPATVGLAPLLAEGSGSRAPQRLWTLAGMPAITLPVGEHGGLPVGVQLIGRIGEDAALLRAAARIEAVVNGRADV